MDWKKILIWVGIIIGVGLILFVAATFGFAYLLSTTHI